MPRGNFRVYKWFLVFSPLLGIADLNLSCVWCQRLLPVIKNKMGSYRCSPLSHWQLTHPSIFGCGRSWARPPVRPNQRLKIRMYCFSAMHVALKNESKDGSARNQNNVSRVQRHVYPWSVASVNLYYENSSQPVNLVQIRYHYHLIDCNLFLPWYSWNISHLALNNNQSSVYMLIPAPPFYLMLNHC